MRAEDRGVASSANVGDVILVGQDVYGRVVDPLSGVGTRNVAAVTVVAPRASHAALLARAGAVLGEGGATDLIRRTPGVTAYFHYAEGLESPTELAPAAPPTQPPGDANP